ncbi:rotamase-domain-containing protein [Multifurca ochricompacta]|uniref:Peptidyl-prolyl cis-trans isomerase n=1 Tax=Multifurca ochricompacta TaxID=376703 RepID=A0AAD4M1B5_9AGAM|nr:rotamase-domain-containing protein [Multifurca ochricompacta]
MSAAAWEVRLSSSQKLPYFYNTETQKSTWKPPDGLTEEQIKALPGASLLDPKEVRASHILVKHSGSRRPSSWKEHHITRSKEEAIAILQGYKAEIGTNADKFGPLARQHSDCSSHDHDGDLGWFGPGQMQKPFEDAAFSLQVGAISGIVESQSGVHLILRTG